MADKEKDKDTTAETITPDRRTSSGASGEGDTPDKKKRPSYESTIALFPKRPSLANFNRPVKLESNFYKLKFTNNI